MVVGNTIKPFICVYYMRLVQMAFYCFVEIGFLSRYFQSWSCRSAALQILGVSLSDTHISCHS